MPSWLEPVSQCGLFLQREDTLTWPEGLPWLSPTLLV